MTQNGNSNMVAARGEKALHSRVENTADLYAANHRRQLQLLCGGVGALLLMGLAPSTERALFLVTGVQTPKAFAVISPPLGEDASSIFSNRAPRSAFLARLRRPIGSSPTDFGAPAAPAALALGAPESLVPIIGSPLSDLVNQGDPARNFQNGPLAGSGPARFSPASAADNQAGTDPVAPDPVGPVPEPATWLMMIAGFFLAGAGLRSHRARKSVELEPISR